MKIQNFIVILAFFLMSATTIATQLIEVKPAKPKSIVTFYCSGSTAAEKIRVYSKGGYQTTHIAATSGGALVEMVKY